MYYKNNIKVNREKKIEDKRERIKSNSKKDEREIRERKKSDEREGYSGEW